MSFQNLNFTKTAFTFPTCPVSVGAVDQFPPFPYSGLKITANCPLPMSRSRPENSSYQNHPLGLVSLKPNLKPFPFYICTLNVRTLKDEYRLDELLNVLDAIKWHVIGLAEIRRNKEFWGEHSSGLMFCHSAA